MLKKLFIKLGIIKDHKAALATFINQIAESTEELSTSVKKAPVKKKVVKKTAKKTAKKAAKKAPVKKKAVKKAK